MDWNDIEAAAHPDNAAYTANQLLGHALILLDREAPRTPFVTPQEGHAYNQPVGRTVRVLNAIWLKHERRRQDDVIAVVKSMEKALDKIENWFQLGFLGGAETVLAEQAFDDAAKRICHANDHWLPGTFTGRFWRKPTASELEADWAIVRRDAQRLAVFEALSPHEWLSQASTARYRRAPWEAAAEAVIGLRLAVESAIPSGAPALRLNRQRSPNA